MTTANSVATDPLENAPSPNFSGPNQSGNLLSLQALQGHHIILFFYPKDLTSGCTTEACNFRDHWQALKALGAVILGVSADSQKSHVKFIAKHSLPFDLIADESKQIIQAFGAWGEKRFMGRKYMGILRKTVWIGPDGQVRKVWNKVKPDEHAQEVLAAIQKEPLRKP